MRSYTNHKKLIVVIGVLAFTVFACIEPYDFKTEEFESALVVEATITNEVAFQQIKLSRTFRFEETGPTFETDATVDIITEDGVLFSFSEIEPGTYMSDTQFGAEIDKQYQLRLTTSNNRTYLSSFESTPVNTQIDNLYAERKMVGDSLDGVSILIDSFDPTRLSNYYQYNYEETYKVTPVYSRVDSLYPADEDHVWPDCDVILAKDNLFSDRGTLCYGTADSSNNILLNSTIDLTEDRVSRFELLFYDQSNPKIANRYSILVNQNVISREAFSYYSTLRDFSNPESLFSETQSGFIEGNITSLENNNEKVIGFFSVISKDSKRIFFNYNDFFTEQFKRGYFFECPTRAWPFVFYNPVPFCLLANIVEKQEFIYAGPNKEIELNEGPYEMVRRECGDCRIFASEEVPNFWID